jgi:hypothetical protein
MVTRGDARMAKGAERRAGARSKKLYGLKKWQYIAINTFLIFHILAISCWCMPLSSPFIGVCRDALRPYFVWSGLFQSWDMFSPQPKATNSYLEALVLYKDGSTKIWSFPRMEQLTLT